MAVFLFFKGKELPKTKISHNKKMRKKGIECALSIHLALLTECV